MRLIRVLFAWLWIFAAPGAAGAITHSTLAPEIQRILSRGRLIVALERTDRAPFFYRDPRSGSLKGIDIELARTVAENLAVEVEFDRSAVTADEAVRRVTSGKADIAISRLSVNLNWAISARFTRPYLVLNQAQLVNRLRRARTPNRSPFGSLGESRARRAVGYLKGSAYEFFAQRYYPDAYPIPYNSLEGMFEDVLRGEIDSAISDSRSIRGWLRAAPQNGIQTEALTFPDRQDQLAMAVAWHSPQLHAWINLFLEQAEKTGLLERIVAAHEAGEPSGGKSH
ncbi:MAG: substrate-binding periplasmic protein [Bacteriovoracia bacterium]